MSASDADLAGLKRAYQAWNDSKGASIDTWLALFADEVDFRSLAGGAQQVAWTKTRASSAEVRGYLEGLTGAFAMVHFTPERFVRDDDCIVMIGTTEWRNKSTGKIIATPIVNVWRFANGKAASFYEYYDTAKLIAAATP